jgi:hypothetical protein
MQCHAGDLHCGRGRKPRSQSFVCPVTLRRFFAELSRWLLFRLGLRRDALLLLVGTMPCEKRDRDGMWRGRGRGLPRGKLSCVFYELLRRRLLLRHRVLGFLRQLCSCSRSEHERHVRCRARWRTGKPRLQPVPLLGQRLVLPRRVRIR